jgi:hypothetical protein
MPAMGERTLGRLVHRTLPSGLLPSTGTAIYAI